MSDWETPFDVRDLTRHHDPRGFLFEILRFKDQQIPPEGQIYTFSIEPGQRRGDHFHNGKHEWFTCVYGEAVILLSAKENVRAVTISDKEPKIVYAAPGTAHGLLNETDTPAVIVSYGSHQHDPSDPDTYPLTAYPGYSQEKSSI